MRSKMLTVVAIAVMVSGWLALSPLGRAQQPDFGRMGRGGMGRMGPMARARMGRGGNGQAANRLLAMLDNDRVKAALGLSDEQSGRLRHIVVNTEEASVRTGAQIQVDRIQLRELLRADDTDRDAVMKKVQEIASLRGEMMQQHVQALLDAKAVLTPEQRKKIRTFMENRAAGGARPGLNGRFRGGPAAPPRPPAPAERPQAPANP